MCSNYIFCSGYKHWVHKKYTKIQGRLVENVISGVPGVAVLLDGCLCNSIALERGGGGGGGVGEGASIRSCRFIHSVTLLMQVVVVPMVQLPELGLLGETSES